MDGTIKGGILNFKLPKIFNRKEKKRSLIKDLMKNPDMFVMTVYTENDELIIKFKRRESV